MMNPLLLTDTYNLSHQDFKINTDWEVSYISNRNAPMILYGLGKTVNIFLNKITIENVEEAEKYAEEMDLWFPSKLFYNVVDHCNGYMPVVIEAIPDGTWVPKGTPFCKVANREKGYGECVTWWEAMLLHAWFPSACATRAFKMRKYLESKGHALTRFHSFGFRGHRSLEDAYWAGTAWNLYLPGTDDFHTKEHTSADIKSIPALAHKVVQQFDNELMCYVRAIDTTAKHGKKAVSIVIDTFNADRFIEEYAFTVADYARKCGITPVFRPDSGDVVKQIEKLWKITSQFNPSFIIGEKMDFEQCVYYDTVFDAIEIPLENVNYGIGAGFYNDLTRDSLGWVMKTSYSNGKDRMKFSTNKVSLPGIIDVVRRNGNMVAVVDDECKDDKSMYWILYTADKKDHYLYSVPWVNIQSKALHQNNEQNDIILSERLQQKMKAMK